MFILGVIPARAGSKGIPNKNTKLMDGIPLIQYSVFAATCSVLDSWVITTDIEDLLDYAVIERPPHLCQDDTPMVPVVQHAVQEYTKHTSITPDAVCLLQPTSPCRTHKDINGAIFQFMREKGTSLYSGHCMGIKTKDTVYDKHKAEKHFQRDGAIFITDIALLNSGKLWDENAIQFELPKSHGIDIDDMDDWFIAESLIKNGVLIP